MAESQLFRQALVSFGSVGAQTVRLLARHWPTVLALTLAGNAARQLLILAATKATVVHAALGSIVFSLVPVALLTAYVVALLAVRGSVADVRAQGERKRGRMIADVGSVLVPFFVIYSSYGQLRADFTDWLNSIQFDTVLGGSLAGRNPWEFSTTMLVVAGCTVAVRLLLDWWKRSQRWIFIGFVKAYLDVVSFTVIFVVILNPVKRMLDERRVVHAAKDLFAGTDVRIGSVSLTEVWHGLTGGLVPVIILPIAWLAIAATIYGDRLREVPSRVELRAYRKITIMPSRMRKAVLGLSAPTRNRFEALILAVRVLRRTNLVFILLFCLGFVLVMSLPYGLWELTRLLVGPREHFTWQELSPPLLIVNDAVTMAVLVCYVAAGVSMVLRLQDGSARNDEVRVPGHQGRLGQPDRDGERIGRRDEVHGPLIAG